MPQFFASGAIAQLVLGLMFFEAALLVVLLRARPGALVPLLANLASGACMIMALGAALTQAEWTTTATWLCGSFLAHGTELVLRLRAAGLAPRGDPAASRELA
ncbi:MAG: hypothetical protein U1E62_25755 [Alsobacter sp.]